MAGIDSFVKLMAHFNNSLADAAGLHTILTGTTPVWSTAPAAFGGANGCIYCAGANYPYVSNLNAGTDFDFGSSDWTIDMRVQFTAHNLTGYGLIYTQSVNEQFGYKLKWNDGGDQKFSLYNAGSSKLAMSGTWTPVDGTWYHLAFVKTNNQIDVRIDNVSVGVIDCTGYNTFNRYGDQWFIMGWADAYFPGNIDEVRVSKGIARTFASVPSSEYNSFPLSGLSSATKGTPAVASIDPVLVAGLASVSGDSYFNQATNWKYISMEYTHSSGQQVKPFSFFNNGSDAFPDASVLFSTKARAGTWTLTKMVLHDFDGGSFVVAPADIAGVTVVVS